MCTSKDAIERKKNEELYEDIPIVKLCPSPSVDTTLASYMHGSDYINAELIANNFYGANEMIYQLEQVLRHRLEKEIDIEKITMEQLGEKIDILISETS